METAPSASAMGGSQPAKPADPPASGKGKGRKKGKDASCVENSKKDSTRNFVWEDDEVELLLSCTVNYKMQKAM